MVNAGSDTFSVFDIDPSDPGNPSYSASYPSNGEFPTSLAVSPDGQVVCVSNSGAQNGLSCYVAGNDGWTHDAQWDRSYGLNLTTPPHGPVGGTPSQIAFSSDGASLLVVIKGQLPTDLNNPTNATQPGAILSYAIDNNGSLAAEPTMTPAALPFSISEDMSAPGVYFLTDVSTGYAVWDSTTPNSTVVQGTIANQAAVCWVAQSPRTGDFYTVDIGGKSNITEVSLDAQDFNGTVITHHGLGVNASGTDNSIFSGAQYDYMYVNAPAYNSVHTFEIQGPGQFSLVQRYGVSDMSGDVVPSGGFVVSRPLPFPSTHDAPELTACRVKLYGMLNKQRFEDQ